MPSERVRLAVEIATDAMRHLDPAELDDALEQLERNMIALAEGRGIDGLPSHAVARAAADVWKYYIGGPLQPLVFGQIAMEALGKKLERYRRGK